MSPDGADINRGIYKQKGGFVKKYALRLSATALAIVALSVVSVWAQNPPAGSPVAVHGQLSVVGNRIVGQHGNPVQLRGMSLFWSQGRTARNFYNAATVSHLASNWQSSVVRAAMGVEEVFSSDEQPYLYDQNANKQRVLNVVAAARTSGIYVIIDWHSHIAENYQSEAISFFREMAQMFNGVPNVIYELYNEPIGPGKAFTNDPAAYWQTIKPYMQAVTNAIRQYDQNNIILIGNPNWCQHPDIAAADSVVGNNLAYTFHFYAAELANGNTGPGPSPAHTSELRLRVAKAMQAGKAVFASEIGSVGANGSGTHNAAQTDTWMQFMDSFNIGWAAWALHSSPQTSAALTSGDANNPNGWNLSTTGNYMRNKLITASSAPTFYAIKLNVVGEGQATVSHGATTSSPFVDVSTTPTVSLLAQAASGWTFAGWSGDFTGPPQFQSSFSLANLTGRTDGQLEITATFTSPFS